MSRGFELTSVQEISVARLCELQKGGPINVIDVRTPAEFGELHATCARNIPLDALDPATLMQDCKGNGDSTLYVICKSGNRSKKACEKFLSAGYENVISIEGGTQAWEAAGFPVVRGRKAMSLERQVRIAAGALVLLGVLLSFVNPYFLGISAFVGAGLIFAGITDTCGMAMLLARAPWNRRSASTGGTCQN